MLHVGVFHNATASDFVWRCPGLYISLKINCELRERESFLEDLFQPANSLSIVFIFFIFILYLAGS